MTYISSNVLGRLAHYVEAAVMKSVDVEGNQAPERNYGYLAVLDDISGDLLMMMKIGNVPVDKVEACKKFALEKAFRIYMNRDFTSWQTRNFAHKHFGGGILAGGLIIAFSGLKEYADEAVCLDASLKIGLIDDKKAAEIVHISSQCKDYPITTTEFLEALQAA